MIDKKLELRTDKESINSTIAKFLSYVEEVPWGNSNWQNQHVIVDMEMTPERAYRHASLRIMNRFQALQECYYAMRKEEVQLKRLRRTVLSSTDDLDKAEAEIEIEKLLAGRPYTEKLIKDAICEINSLSPVIESMGKLTREQFEDAELEHFKKVYLNASKPEALRALENMGFNLVTGELSVGSSLFAKITKELSQKLVD